MTSTQPPDLGPMSEARWLAFFVNYAGLPHQVDGLLDLRRQIIGARAGILTEDNPWRKTYSTPRLPATTNPLNVRYFWQQDNGAEGWRQCQTSAIAMCLNYKGVNVRDDLDYLRFVRKYGDTTERRPHIDAMRELGYRGFQWHQPSKSTPGLSAARVRDEIDKGNPVVLGTLHHGPVSRPTGGGHMITVIGYSVGQWICHDPFGELDLVNGGWARQGKGAGRAVAYSFKNLNPRVFVGGPTDGWGWTFQ